MNEKQAARRIIEVLKESQKPFVNLRDLAQGSGFKGAYTKDFKKGFKLLEREGIVKLYRSGWPSEGYHRTNAVLLVDIYGAESLELKLKDEGEFDHEQNLNPEDQIQDFILVAIQTPCGETSYISRAAYEAEKKGNNLWSELV